MGRGHTITILKFFLTSLGAVGGHPETIGYIAIVHRCTFLESQSKIMHLDSDTIILKNIHDGVRFYTSTCVLGADFPPHSV